MNATHAALRPVRSKADMDAALARIDELWEAEPGTPEADESEALAILVETFERENYAWPPADDPIAVVQVWLDEGRLAPRDLAPMLGSEEIVSEVMTRKRPLTVEMIRNLHRHLGIPLEDLIG